MGVEAVLERRSAERSALLSRAGEWVERLASEIDLRGACVFGSVARGDFNRWSDVDLLLIAAGVGGGPLERAERCGPRPPRVQPVIWTTAEAPAELRRGNPIALEAVAAGVWLLGSPRLLRPEGGPPESP